MSGLADLFRVFKQVRAERRIGEAAQSQPRARNLQSLESDFEHAAEVRRLSMTLDRVNDVPTVCEFIDGLIKGQSRAGFLLLCGLGDHALTDFATRITRIAHDPLPEAKPLRSRSVRPALHDLRPIRVGRSVEDDLAAWLDTLTADGDGRQLHKALIEASLEGDLWVITFTIERNRRDQVECIRRHLGSFVEAVRVGSSEYFASWGPAKFLVVYCIECEEKIDDYAAIPSHFMQFCPVQIMKEWRRITAQDIDDWFDWAESQREARALRNIDLYEARISVRRRVCGEDAAQEASMRKAIDALYEHLKPHRTAAATHSQPTGV